MSRRPEKLILALLGEFVLGRPSAALPASTVLAALSSFDLPEATLRATLRRMVQRQLLRTVRAGRSVSYELTDRSVAVLSEADRRVRSESPFSPIGPGWTLVSYSVPERHRESRHRLRSSLVWAGFGLLRDGLWIAPGHVDARRILELSRVSVADASLTIFSVDRIEDIGRDSAIRSAWDLEAIGRRHREFATEWTSTSFTSDPVHDVVALLSDWLDVLRSDPRLPASALPPDWPSALSAHSFHTAYTALHPTAQRRFHQMASDQVM